MTLDSHHSNIMYSQFGRQTLEYFPVLRQNTAVT